ncbi:Ca2+ regulator and membrane fusion protein Fig1-domain-containing protein [Achaetomium macrosporum]|uniref:Ca2+ regulator and membrane fusion protein Fig1-domain-containing protein n=1 Tax=Achaetomium macrosporum TaxID=79813 RepID=A0AAN7CCS4_9PEZI|nr:Ca2+ regulator and membrane fusion protein Fig1-domain-containing protein [Achaetomium macrosporum]
MTLLKNLAKLYFTPYGMLRYAPYLLIVPIIVFQALSLTGCVSTSPGVPNIYIVSLRPNNNATDDPLQVRIGYFGICGIDEEGKRCQSASGRSVETLRADLFPEVFGPNNNNNSSSSSNTTASANGDEITDLVSTAIDLQSRIFISVLAGAAVLFLLGIAALVLYKRDVSTGWDEHPRRSAIIRRVTYGMLFGSAGLAFAAALATSESAGALEYTTSDTAHATVLIHAGRTLQVLQWVAFGFETLFALAVPFLVAYRAPPVAEEWKGEA